MILSKLPPELIVITFKSCYSYEDEIRLALANKYLFNIFMQHIKIPGIVFLEINPITNTTEIFKIINYDSKTGKPNRKTNRVTFHQKHNRNGCSKCKLNECKDHKPAQRTIKYNKK
ncbi:11231_t:CDS:1, partial [Acaulospora morrowiae]